MSLDNSIRAIAYSEAATLSGALALIAKRRNDLDAAIRADAANPMPVTSDGAAELRAMDAIETQHRLDRKA